MRGRASDEKRGRACRRHFVCGSSVLEAPRVQVRAAWKTGEVEEESVMIGVACDDLEVAARFVGVLRSPRRSPGAGDAVFRSLLGLG